MNTKSPLEALCNIVTVHKPDFESFLTQDIRTQINQLLGNNNPNTRTKPHIKDKGIKNLNEQMLYHVKTRQGDKLLEEQNQEFIRQVYYFLQSKVYKNRKIIKIAPSFNESYDHITKEKKDFSFINPCFYRANVFFEELKQNKEALNIQNIQLHLDMYNETHNPEYNQSKEKTAGEITPPTTHFFAQFDHEGKTYILEYAGYNKLILRLKGKEYVNFNKNTRRNEKIPNPLLLLDEKSKFDTKVNLMNVFIQHPDIQAYEHSQMFGPMLQEQVSKYRKDIDTIHSADLPCDRFEIFKIAAACLVASLDTPGIYYRTPEGKDLLVHF